ncbi:hypothetical protein M752DRAFT_302668 [Aspergillus phoenicis ATCC 13157]|uniref:RNase H type-1 domain-containing protein n=1 Tax=Aspergillus phoenicis ATCC 13157 TaxID=1353007 RepID=A0A370PFV9_ASPPH|nr:hypothetical protein M752DRAFT_302668 [Aspergillus phoenicis ATCC 13157]
MAPYWMPPDVTIDTNAEMAMVQHEVITEHGHSITAVYTNGHGIKGRIDAAAACPQHQDGRSIIVLRRQIRHAIIFTDNQAVLRAFQNPGPQSGQYLLETILVALEKAREHKLSIRFQRGISGNEQLDMTAKKPQNGGRSAPDATEGWISRAFDGLDLEKQQFIKSIPLPTYNKLIKCHDANISPDTLGRLKALSGVVETVNIQYELDQEKSRIKEPAQKIIKAVLSFQDFIQAAVAFDPTGHATSVWTVVSLGLTKVALLESCAFLTDMLTRYIFVEDEYQNGPNTDEHVETALIQVYIAVLTFAALVQSLYDRGCAIWIWKSMSGDPLSELQKSIDEAESQLD